MSIEINICINMRIKMYIKLLNIINREIKILYVIELQLEY